MKKPTQNSQKRLDTITLRQPTTNRMPYLRMTGKKMMTRMRINNAVIFVLF